MGHDQAACSEIIQAGLQWDGTGATTGRCATLLYSAVGVSLVSAVFTDYLHAHLFALCLVWSLDVPQLQLSDRAGEAAFQLAQLYKEEPASTPMQTDNTPSQGHGDAEGDHDGFNFAWEEQEELLPPELTHLWKRSVKSTHRLGLRAVLEQVPRWA